MKLKSILKWCFFFALVLVIASFFAEAQSSTNVVVEAGAAGQTTEIDVSIKREPSVLLTFGLDRLPILQKELWGNPRWQYIASFIYIFLAFYISKTLDFLTRIWLRRFAEKTSTPLDDVLLELLNGPIKIISFVILLHIGLNFFKWPDWAEEVLSKGLKVIVAMSVTYALVKGIDVLMGYWRDRSKADDRAFDEQLFPILRKSLKLFVMVIAVLVTLDSLGLPIRSVIALGSVGALAIGLAAQDTIGNLFGAVTVFLDKPFRVGDRIKLPEVDGVVETIGLRSTRVRNLDGHLITVPNKTMGNATITNITRRPNIKTTMNISITYDTPTEKVQRALQILDDVYRKHPMTHDVWISFNQFADSSLNIMVIHWWNGVVFKDYLAGVQEMNLSIKKQFDEEGISFAFPTRTLYLKQDSDWRFTANGAAQSAPPPETLLAEKQSKADQK